MTTNFKGKKITGVEKGQHSEEYTSKKNKNRKFKQLGKMISKEVSLKIPNGTIVPNVKKHYWEVKRGKRKTLFSIIINFGKSEIPFFWNEGKRCLIYSADSSPEIFGLALNEALNA